MTASSRIFRARFATALLAFLPSALAETPAFAGNNPVTTAPLRLRIEKIAQTDWPAKMGVVDIAPCWSPQGRFGIFDAAGKPVAFQTVWSAEGDATRVCFDTS